MFPERSATRPLRDWRTGRKVSLHRKSSNSNTISEYFKNDVYRHNLPADAFGLSHLDFLWKAIIINTLTGNGSSENGHFWLMACRETLWVGVRSKHRV